ncbi:hypothetical protein ABZY05_21885 [Streptomyces canus]|uniref:hypothetical protein n=1 Tax=Streptomyces canus TaxID=58343 RepID=UPI0033B9C2E1
MPSWGPALRRHHPAAARVPASQLYASELDPIVRYAGVDTHALTGDPVPSGGIRDIPAPVCTGEA